jgi:hypothetical protein
MMPLKKPRWAVVGLWLAWLIIISGFQVIADMRYDPDRPDEALEWTGNETTARSQRDKPYLIEPFMNHQVSWDSEFYLSIAVAGYDDPLVRTVEVEDGRELSLNYAFFPLYPLAIRALSIPLSIVGLTPIATATLAGVIISAFSALVALLAVYELVQDELGDSGGIRTTFYLLVFPTSFFLATVFTESFFLALALGCMALLKRQVFFWAALLAFLAALTRASGVLLIIPLGIAWLNSIGWRNIFTPTVWLNRQNLLRFGLIFTPIIGFVIWRITLGEAALLVEDTWFGRGLDNPQRTFDGWRRAIETLLTTNIPERRIYYGMEFTSVLLAIIGSLFVLRRYPGIALFSLAALAAGMFTSAPQSLVRYVLTAPALFIFLGRLGKSVVFDRAWTLGSILFLGMQAFLFAHDMWVA